MSEKLYECLMCEKKYGIEMFEIYNSGRHRGGFACSDICKLCALEDALAREKEARAREREVMARVSERESAEYRTRLREVMETARKNRNRPRSPGHVTEWVPSGTQLEMIKQARARFAQVLAGVLAESDTMAMVGCGRTDLCHYLERQWLPGMSWITRGCRVGAKGEKPWHIDHILPVSAFDHGVLEERKACWHYTNLRPLWASENCRKCADVSTSMPEALVMGVDAESRERIKVYEQVIARAGCKEGVGEKEV